MRSFLKIFVVTAVTIIVVPPVARASRNEPTIMIPDDGDLTISWKTRTFTDDMRLRLYVVNPSGSKELLTERRAHRGIGTYRFVDRRMRDGRLIQYRLCAVAADGREITLAVANCSEPHVNHESPAFSSVAKTMAGLSAASGGLHVDLSSRLRPAQGAMEEGSRPRPPVPVPRTT